MENKLKNSDNFLIRARKRMEKNAYLRKLIPPIQETKLCQYKRQFIHRRGYLADGLQKARETKDIFAACYYAHPGEFERLAGLLEDDLSRRTVEAIAQYRICPAVKTLLPVVSAPMYFRKDILRPVENEVFIDGGGYAGDSIVAMAAFWGKNRWKRIYSWEPDRKNRGRLAKTCEDHRFENVEIIPLGMWSERTQLRFDMQGTVDSSVSETGDSVIDVDTIDHLCSGEKVTFIKMDIEGSERQALRGAEMVIRRDRPKLAISIYHRPEDYYEIPFMIKEMVPEYKLYIRHHKFNKNDTVLYATV